jgi:hypothetical protein
MTEKPKAGETPREKMDIRTRPVLFFLAGLAVLVALVLLGLWLWMARHYRAPLSAFRLRPELREPQPPRPPLGVDIRGQLQDLRRREDEILTTYAWVDREKRLARVPIQRAMELLARGKGRVPSHDKKP